MTAKRLCAWYLSGRTAMRGSSWC